MPISRKDAALNSLVNFDNLNLTGKQESVEKSAAEAKPVYIDSKQAPVGFVPEQTSAAAFAPTAPIFSIENSSAPAF